MHDRVVRRIASVSGSRDRALRPTTADDDDDDSIDVALGGARWRSAYDARDRTPSGVIVARDDKCPAALVAGALNMYKISFAVTAHFRSIGSAPARPVPTRPVAVASDRLH